MGKPDDVGQWAWDASLKHKNSLDYRSMSACEFIARAIQTAKAEAYEEAAKVADEAHEDAEEYGAPIWANKIAAAIRKLGSE